MLYLTREHVHFSRTPHVSSFYLPVLQSLLSNCRRRILYTNDHQAIIRLQGHASGLLKNLRSFNYLLKIRINKRKVNFFVYTKTFLFNQSIELIHQLYLITNTLGVFHSLVLVARPNDGSR